MHVCMHPCRPLQITCRLCHLFCHHVVIIFVIILSSPSRHLHHCVIILSSSSSFCHHLVIILSSFCHHFVIILSSSSSFCHHFVRIIIIFLQTLARRVRKFLCGACTNSCSTPAQILERRLRKFLRVQTLMRGVPKLLCNACGNSIPMRAQTFLR